MNVGEVCTFPRINIPEPREQAIKILEEAAEVFSEVQLLDDWDIEDTRPLQDECADVIMATCNLLYSIGCGNINHLMKACEKRNEERGRYDIQKPN